MDTVTFALRQWIIAEHAKIYSTFWASDESNQIIYLGSRISALLEVLDKLDALEGVNNTLSSQLLGN